MAFSWTNSVPSAGSKIDTNFILEARSKEDTLHNRLCLAHNNADLNANVSDYYNALNDSRDASLNGTFYTHDASYLTGQYSSQRSHNSGYDTHNVTVLSVHNSFCGSQVEHDGTYHEDYNRSYVAVKGVQGCA